MINTPMKYTPIKSLEELRAFSYRIDKRMPEGTTNIFWQNNGQIAYCDEWGDAYVTPYRPEVDSLLEKAGYHEKGLYVPFSNGEDRPEQYIWLSKIAKEECWAKEQQDAFKVAKEKGIKEVELDVKNLHIKEISSGYKDDATGNYYYKIDSSQNLNVGTYIIVDTKTLVVCDEYGRTFLLKVKTCINDIVNMLLDAGYTRTPNPHRYVKLASKE